MSNSLKFTLEGKIEITIEGQEKMKQPRFSKQPSISLS